MPPSNQAAHKRSANSSLTEPLDHILYRISSQPPLSKQQLWELCRHSDLGMRAYYRDKAYEAVIGFLRDTMPIGKQQEFEGCLALLKPILTGALGDGLSDSKEVHQALKDAGDKLALFLYKEQAMVIKFLDLLSAAYGLCLPLPETLIEAGDPKHLPAAKGLKKLYEWGGSSAKPFFNYRVKREGEKVKQGVKYLRQETKRTRYKAEFRAGEILIGGQPLDTTQAKCKQNGYHAYVVSADGTLYIAPHESGHFQHSSFLACGPVLCAGMIKVKEGKIVDITNHSGHYRPNLQAFREALRIIPQTVYAKKSSTCLTGIKIRGESPRFLRAINYCVSSDFSRLRRIGRLLRSIIGKGNRDSIIPLYLVRNIGMRLTPSASGTIIGEVNCFFKNQEKFDEKAIKDFLAEFNKSTDKLSAIIEISKLYGIKNLLSNIDPKTVTEDQKEIALALRNSYRDELQVTVAKIAGTNEVIVFLDEKKRKNCHVNDIRKIKESEIDALLVKTDSSKEKIKKLEEAALSILFFGDFKATQAVFPRGCFENVKLSDLQIVEMKLLLKIYYLIHRKDSELVHDESSLLRQFSKSDCLRENSHFSPSDISFGDGSVFLSPQTLGSVRYQ